MNHQNQEWERRTQYQLYIILFGLKNRSILIKVCIFFFFKTCCFTLNILHYSMKRTLMPWESRAFRDSLYGDICFIMIAWNWTTVSLRYTSEWNKSKPFDIWSVDFWLQNAETFQWEKWQPFTIECPCAK